MLTKEEKRAIEHLGELVEVLDNNRINFWLHAGTVLGYIRSKKEHLNTQDIDFDFVIWPEESRRVGKILPELESRGFYVKKAKDKVKIYKDNFEYTIGVYDVDSDPRNSVRYTVALKNKVGIFIYYRLIIRTKKEAIIRILLLVGMITKSLHLSKKTIPSKYFFNLRKENMFGVRINIPNDTEEYLLFKYGKGWTVPVSPEDWEHDTISEHYQKNTDISKLLEFWRKIKW